jgi:GT2 family glycosyltransferase
MSERKPDRQDQNWADVRSVLAVGAPLAQTAAASRHWDVRTCEWSVSDLSALDRSYDLALCLDAPLLAPDQCAAIVRALHAHSHRILFSSRSISASTIWLRAFLSAGYIPDLAPEEQWEQPGAVLLRSGAECFDVASVLAAVLHLRSQLALRGPGVAIADQEDTLARISALTAEALERQDEFLQKADLRVSLLHARVNQLDHTVNLMVNSRIWRTLVALGGMILHLRQTVSRFVRPRVSPSMTSELQGGFIKVHCDEPEGSTLDRILQTGISGKLRVKGWAVAASGIRRVELQLGDAPPVEARIGLQRLDIQKAHPQCHDSLMSGFVGQVDCQGLTNGMHSLRVRAFPVRGDATEIQLPIKVDHIHGYADEYHRWMQDFERRDPKQIRLRLETFQHRPRISLIVPVYKTRPAILEKAISSVLDQSYPDWELCIADDCSRSEEIDSVLDRFAALDQRIKVVRLPENGGISAASNAALEMATGEFIGLLDHDDELAADALFHVVDVLNRHPDTDLVYSDEDHIDDNGLRSDPFFKPDWSPDLILGENYVCHFLVLRAALVRELGAFRTETDLSQDMDITLRASTQARRIVHIPRILYHWRTNVYTSDRASDAQRQRALATSRRAVEDHLNVIAPRATVVPGEVPSRWRVRYPVPENQLVRILIPCGGKVELLRNCLSGLFEKTDYRKFRISVLDNSQGENVADCIRRFSHDGRQVSHMDFRGQPFNFSAMNNAAARDAREPLLLFLNDDVTVIHRDWLTAMVELASRPEVGAVGPKLLYPDNTIQHAGLVVGVFGTCGHGFKGAPADDRLYFDFPHLIRNVSAVTGACMLVPTAKYWECGGFDEEAFPVSYQDVDLCLKLAAKGYRILFTPHARLYHHEAVSKRSADKDPRPAETMIFKSRWKRVIENDPFYSPNLTVAGENYSYRARIE